MRTLKDLFLGALPATDFIEAEAVTTVLHLQLHASCTNICEAAVLTAERHLSLIDWSNSNEDLQQSRCIPVCSTNTSVIARTRVDTHCRGASS